MRKVQRVVPEMLATGNLTENLSKREEYVIPGYETTWKKCKCLGSMVNTENDIKRRKGLTYDAMKKLGKLFRSHHLTIPSKCRIFEAYISSVMLYNRVNNFGS